MHKSLLLVALTVPMVFPSTAANLSLENRSAASIPLDIPGVMNPNLSPNSRSGVTLNEGQKVYFRHNGKRALLLEIKDEKDGETIVVDEVLAKRVQELEQRK